MSLRDKSSHQRMQADCKGVERFLLRRSAFGFGFDPKTNVYKLVRVMIPLPGVTYKAEVCSLRNNSWRLIAGTDSFMEGVIVDDMWRSRAVVKNAVHWCGALKRGS